MSLENDAAGRSRSAGAAACRSGERGEHDNEGEEDLAYTRHDELHSVGVGQSVLTVRLLNGLERDESAPCRIRDCGFTKMRPHRPTRNSGPSPMPDFSAFTDPLTLILQDTWPPALTRFAPGQVWCPR